jgi:hypothetical protein
VIFKIVVKSFSVGNYDLEGVLIGGVEESIVALHHIAEREAMGDELFPTLCDQSLSRFSCTFFPWTRAS